MYNEVVDDPKVQRLPPVLFRAWVNFMCIASKYGGVLPEIADVAYKLHVTKMKAEYLQSELVKANLFEWTNRVCHPHNWTGRQFKTDDVTERVKRFRHGGRNVSSDENVTADETDQIQSRPETETDQKPLKPLAGPKYSVEFEEFWTNSSRRGSKAKAYVEWKKLKPDHDLEEKIKAGMLAWLASEQWQDETKQPHICRWLNRRGWEEIVPRKALAKTADAAGGITRDYYNGLPQ